MLNQTGRRTTISFSGTVAGNSRLTLVSKHLTFPYRVVEFAASFAAGTDRTLELSPILGTDTDAPTAPPIIGANLLAQTGQVEFIVGDAERKVMQIEIINPTQGSFLKVHANNNDSFEHTIDAQITVEILEFVKEEPPPRDETTQSSREAGPEFQPRPTRGRSSRRRRP